MTVAPDWFDDMADCYGLASSDMLRRHPLEDEPFTPAVKITAETVVLGAPYGGVDVTAVIGRSAQDREWMRANGPAIPTALRPVIHPTARVCALVVIDSGTVRPTRIGARAFLMASCHIGHDCQVGDNVEIAPNTTLCGHVEVGDDVRIGCNVAILPYRKIGAGARVGAGSVVTHDVPAGEVWCGSPARRLRRP